MMPVIFGVLLASVTIEYDPFSIKLGDFNFAAFSGAMISNIAFALRSIYTKSMFDTHQKKEACKAKNLTSDNVFAVGPREGALRQLCCPAVIPHTATSQVCTIFAFFIAVPCALFLEGEALGSSIDTILSKQQFALPMFRGSAMAQLAQMHVITGLFFYL